MAWNFHFSRIVLCAILFAISFTSANVSAQTVRIRKNNQKNNRTSVSTVVDERRNLGGNEYEIFDLVNRERSRKGLGNLAWDASLAQIARSYSRQMARESFFSHFDSRGNSVVERVKDSGIRGWRSVGENLFFCEGYANFNQLAVRGWMTSTDHRRNILERRYNTSGIGIAQSRDGRIYITQVFMQR